MTVTLQPMTDDKYVAWRKDATANYAAEKVCAGNWLPEEAAALAQRDFDRLLPQGTETPGHFLRSVVSEDGTHVGVVWFGPGPAECAYLYDIVIFAEHRSHGYGEAAMLALEDAVRSLGLRCIALHVFGHNVAARRLYEKLGYTITNVNMVKALPD
ncbi:MAG: GNAT family N-acetyltransferase [Anaerolineae bacterium]